MTDINPQWRYKAMAEVYGECGVGWKYTIDRLWIEEGVAGERMACAQVLVQTKFGLGDEWNHPIPGIGGSMLIAKEKDGLRTNDEAYKMAVTDALSVAMKMLGVGSAIYEGRWDGSKYRDAPMAPITPTAGIQATLTPDQIEKVEKVASNMIDMFEAQRDIEEQYRCMEEAKLENEEKILLWTFLDSKQRSALKKHHESLKVKA
jgi:hypothetical protein